MFPNLFLGKWGGGVKNTFSELFRHQFFTIFLIVSGLPQGKLNFGAPSREIGPTSLTFLWRVLHPPSSSGPDYIILTMIILSINLTCLLL
jgi:hypothetical protein